MTTPKIIRELLATPMVGPDAEPDPDPEPAPVGVRPTGPERFEAMTPAEQDEAVGPELAAAIRRGEVKFSELRHRDAFGRVEARDVEDVK